MAGNAKAAPTPFFLDGHFAPVQAETDGAGIRLPGTVPKGLNGTLYRNGPNPRFPRPDAHWFTGDGMIHAITLGDGCLSYRNRWVRTPKWRAEDRAGRALYRGFAGLMPDAPNWTPRDQGAANTHIVRHGGRLLALEEAHPPTDIDPHSLETRGYHGFGAYTGRVTAHPKIDPVTGDLVFFAYNADGPISPAMAFGVVDRAGRLRRHERFEAPYAAMVHDFAITAHHVLFPVLPLTGSLERARRGLPVYGWEPDRGAAIGVMPRTGGAADLRWFRGDACYAFHIMNAWEEGGVIIAEAIVFDQPPFFPRADGAPGDPGKQRGRLTRWRLDPAAATDRFAQSPVDDLVGEFPRIDERRTGLRHRHGWFACAGGRSPTPALDGLAHIDHGSGSRRTWWLAPGDAISEPVFAPRGAGEGDGWLLAVASKAETGRSELLVFEAGDIAPGPIAAIALPHRIPAGFHGSWVAAEDLP
jgi:carotenoid cleavage dioxygenase